MAESFQTAQAQEMTTLVQDGVPKVLQGQTDYGQVKAADQVITPMRRGH